MFTRKGERFARWTDAKGHKRSAKVTTPADGPHAGTDRLLIEARTYTAKYRDGSGQLRKVATGCRELDAARQVLGELERRADRVRCGSLSAAEDAVLDHRATPLSAHSEAYLAALATKRGKGGKPRVSPRHVLNVRHCLDRAIAGCGFSYLRDLNRDAVER